MEMPYIPKRETKNKFMKKKKKGQTHFSKTVENHQSNEIIEQEIVC